MKKTNSYKRVIVLGGIGKTDRENRDAMRVLGGGGATFTLISHISVEPPKVLRRYERTDCDRKNGSSS
jgi:hypothetical protein